jgi:hypothetical protein
MCGPRARSRSTVHGNLPIGDVETVAEKLVAEIRVAKPAQLSFSFIAASREMLNALEGAAQLGDE